MEINIEILVANESHIPYVGTFEDAVYLIELAKNKIKDEFDIEIEEEIILYK